LKLLLSVWKKSPEHVCAWHPTQRYCTLCIIHCALCSRTHALHSHSLHSHSLHSHCSRTHCTHAYTLHSYTALICSF
jgi:hypothetical protein